MLVNLEDRKKTGREGYGGVDSYSVAGRLSGCVNCQASSLKPCRVVLALKVDRCLNWVALDFQVAGLQLAPEQTPKQPDDLFP